MNLTTIAIHKLSATLVTSDAPTSADCGARLAEDAQPCTYIALTERPADFEGFFAPPHRASLGVVRSYTALKERPVDCAGLFVPQRRRCTDSVPAYKALTERPCGSSTDESIASKTPHRIQHIAA
jgi:hypothetical protein